MVFTLGSWFLPILIVGEAVTGNVVEVDMLGFHGELKV